MSTTPISGLLGLTLAAAAIGAPMGDRPRAGSGGVRALREKRKARAKIAKQSRRRNRR
jgi:hypothetical protein